MEKPTTYPATGRSWLLLTALIPMASLCQVSDNPCNMRTLDPATCFNHSMGTIDYKVTFSDCTKEGDVCGWPHIHLSHTFPGVATLEVMFAGSDCKGERATTIIVGNNLPPHTYDTHQGNWHSLRSIEDILHVEVRFQNGEDDYEIVYDKNAGINRTSRNGSPIQANGKTEAEEAEELRQHEAQAQENERAAQERADEARVRQEQERQRQEADQARQQQEWDRQQERIVEQNTAVREGLDDLGRTILGNIDESHQQERAQQDEAARAQYQRDMRDITPQDDEIPCPRCSGTGRRSCGECRGTGHLTCDECGGSGKQTCMVCSGSGSMNFGTLQSYCPNCMGTGQSNCLYCSFGRVNCNDCDGIGRVDCDECDGDGMIDNPNYRPGGGAPPPARNDPWQPEDPTPDVPLYSHKPSFSLQHYYLDPEWEQVMIEPDRHITQVAPTDRGCLLVISTQPGYEGFEIDWMGVSFPADSVKRAWDMGLRITNAGSDAEHGWHVVMCDNTGLTEQTYKLSRPELSGEFIQAQWDKGNSITALASSGGEWFTLCSSNSGLGQQSYLLSPTFPADFIKEHSDQDYYITSAAVNGGTWGIIMSKTARYTKQVYTTSASFPADWVKQEWDLGYRITTVAHGSTWLVVMSKFQ